MRPNSTSQTITHPKSTLYSKKITSELFNKSGIQIEFQYCRSTSLLLDIGQPVSSFQYFLSQPQYKICHKSSDELLLSHFQFIILIRSAKWKSFTQIWVVIHHSTSAQLLFQSSLSLFIFLFNEFFLCFSFVLLHLCIINCECMQIIREKISSGWITTIDCSTVFSGAGCVRTY